MAEYTLCPRCGSPMLAGRRCPNCSRPATPPSASHHHHHHSGEPHHSAPAPEAPVYTAPAPEAPVYTAPAPEAPVYTAPAPEAPVYTAPAPEAPVYTAPAPEAPVYTAPAQIPVYRAPEPEIETFRSLFPDPEPESEPEPISAPAAAPDTKEYRRLMEKTYAPMGAWGIFGTLLLFFVPLVGWIFALVFACGGCRKKQKKSLARAFLLLLGLAALLTALGFVGANLLPHLFASPLPLTI